MGHRAGVNPANSERGVGALRWPTSTHAARRFIMEQLPGASPVEFLGADGEPRRRSDEPPILATPSLVEGRAFQSIRVAPERGARLTSAFAGFLDGTQEVHVINHYHGIPVVWGTVCAAVRVRRNRRLVAWERQPPAVVGRYYLPLRYLAQLAPGLAADERVIDTALADGSGSIPPRHPAALLERAMERIQRDRETVEQKLAAAWCSSEAAPLYVDGSITADATVAKSRIAIGVIKSHRTLYAEGDAFGVVVGLAPGQRSSVFRVAPRSRHAVVSWYLRVRSAVGRDALFGLVRVEAAETADVTARADEVSRWIIAEGSPLALPDARWDKMTYGVRDTEEFLRAIS